jgi:hypothetical protein
VECGVALLLIRCGAAVLLTLILLTGCSPAPQPRAHSADGEWFTEYAKNAGLDFVHVNGMSGKFYMSEILGPGVALFDYDNDGDLDVFVVQGRMLGSEKTAPDATFPPKDGSALKGRLFRNDLRVHPDGTRTLGFTDVTEQSRINANGYGMGAAAGDYNNDGWVDLYVTNFGRNQLWRNNGDGTFADASKESGTDSAGWSVSAAFVDIDRDGWLDLYVGNYLRYSLEANTACVSPSGAKDYCTPRTYQPLPDRLFRNRGNGTFEDITTKARIGTEFGPALGIATADFNGDGWMDIYVANDSHENQLWLNQHNLTFVNTALLSGVALPVNGKAEASMGVDAGDFDNDGDEDLFMTELTGEGSNLYVNDGSGTFDDHSISSGLGPSTMSYTGFGTAWFDVDNDGWLDILSVNGTVQVIEALRQAHDPFPLHQRKLLFHNAGNGRFEDATGKGGGVLQLSEVSRGAAFGDVDNDGDTDVVIANNNGPMRLLVNNVGNRKHWIGLRLVGGGGPRDMLGARVEIVRKDGARLWRRARADGSYASANDPRVLIGMGDSNEAPRVRVWWPDGRGEEWTSVPVDRYTTLTEGSGK